MSRQVQRNLVLQKDRVHMFESSLRTFPAAMRMVLFVVALLHSPVPSHAQQGPFAALSGGWSGGGSITLASGQRERLRCRANYNVGENGTRLQQSLRCASDSYRFDVNGNIRSEEHTSELQSLRHLVCRLLLEKKKNESMPCLHSTSALMS